ncbi:MAG: ATP-binding protein [Deltaproteobacteria bacterium]|nr:ATP-binding protein [Deltaproteobacteria bacterium]
MKIRTKVWLLVAASVAVTVTAASWIRASFTEAMLVRHALSSAEDLAQDIVEEVSQPPTPDPLPEPSAEQQRRRRQQQAYLGEARQKPRRRTTVAVPVAKTPDIEPTVLDEERLRAQLSEFLQHHPSLLWVELELVDSKGRPELRVFASPHYGPDLFKTSATRALDLLPQALVEEDEIVLRRPVKVQGQWSARLTMSWTLRAVRTAVGVAERSSLIFAGVILVLLAVIAVAITERLVVRRLRGLEQAMRAVEEGNLGQRVVEGSSDEIGSLSAGFNRMVGRLAEADAEIRKFNERLEGEVQSATLNLQQKNKALEHLARLLHDLRRENATKVRLAGLAQLAAQLAHEVGTPLSSISGHLQLALLRADVSDPLRQRLDVVSREVSRIGQIFRGYLDSTRDVGPDLKPTPWLRVVQEAVEVISSAEPSRQLHIHTHSLAQGSAPTEIVTDPGLLRQVLINLLTNASDAMEGRGDIEISAAAEANRLRITVKDSGPGIPADRLIRIFEPFFTTKQAGKGTGLGLSISRQLAISLGGDLTVESAPGEGACFSVSLPFVPNEGPRPSLGASA